MKTPFQGFRAKLAVLLVIGILGSIPDDAAARLRTEVQMGDPTDTDWGPTPKSTLKAGTAVGPSTEVSAYGLSQRETLRLLARVVFAMRYWRVW